MSGDTGYSTSLDRPGAPPPDPNYYSYNQNYSPNHVIGGPANNFYDTQQLNQAAASPGGTYSQPFWGNTQSQYQTQANNQDYAQSWGAQHALAGGFLDAAPDYAQRQLDREQLGNQIAYGQANEKYQTGQMQADYQSGLSRADLDTKNQDVQRGALARQPGYLGTLHGLAQQGFDINRQDVQAQAAQHRRALDSQLTARGAYGSVLGNQGRYDIQTQQDRDLSGIGLQSQGETARYNENLAQVGDQNKTLDIMAQKTGLDKSDLARTLQSGLDQLHLSTITNVKDLMDKMQSSNLQDRIQAQQIANDALKNKDYYAQQAPPYPGENPDKSFHKPGATFR